jgi:putative tricarboxylic transport membrane protein
VNTADAGKPAIRDKGELAFAGLLLALGVFVLIDAGTIDVPLAASNVGPRAFPYLAGAILTASAALVVIEIVRGQSGDPEESELVEPHAKFSWRKVGLLVASVVAFAVLLNPAGYVIANTVAFFGIAFTLGARHYVRAAIGSLLLSLLVYVGFTRGLNIYLPPGVLQGIL